MSCHAPHVSGGDPCASCHRGDPQATRAELAHARLLTGAAAAWRDASVRQQGSDLAEAAACRRCHTIDGRGAALATDLGRVAGTREQRELRTSILEPVDAMPRFGFDERQADTVVAWLLGTAGTTDGADAYRVHFHPRGAALPSGGFEELCGGCHRALTTRGPLGRGSVGPNLSGLFTGFYPPATPDGRPWTAPELDRWVRNPRSLRPQATMPPVGLTPDQMARVVRELSSGPG